MKEKLSINEIRSELRRFQNKISRIEGKNKLSKIYLTKVRYMLRWFRLIPIKKNYLNNWVMPDYNNISKMNKEVKEK